MTDSKLLGTSLRRLRKTAVLLVYATMDSDTLDTSSADMTPRNPWVIVLLVLFFDAFVFAYCGRLRRGLAWHLSKWFIFLPILGTALLYVPYRWTALIMVLLIALMLKLFPIVDALSTARKDEGKEWRSYQRWWSYLGLLLVFLTVDALAVGVVRAYWSEAYFLPTASMSNTLFPGDRFSVEKLLFSFQAPQRGQVVAFYVPEQEGLIYVKRIIAIGGDSIRIVNDQVEVNGKIIDEPYVVFTEPDTTNDSAHVNVKAVKAPSDIPQTIVPDGHVYLLGDNRWRSYDSRFFGPVSVERLVGRVCVIFWSHEYAETFNWETRSMVQEWGDIRWDRIGVRIE